MAEAEGIPPTASVASVGPGIRYVGNWVYAYSGEITVADSELVLLEFTTGSGIIVGNVQFNATNVAGDDYIYFVKFNNIPVQGYTVLESVDRGKADYPIAVVIPPFTLVTITARNVTDADGNAQMVSLTGRVYDV